MTNVAQRTKIVYGVATALATLAQLIVFNARAEESTFVYAVQISASVQESPPQITLNWEPDPYGANSYTVYRKSKTDTSWGVGAILSGASSVTSTPT